MLTVLTILLLAAWLAMALAPYTPIARYLRGWLVEAPAKLCDRITRGHVLLVVGMGLFVALVVWQLQGDGLALLGMMAPEIVAWVTMFEVSVWLDVAVAAITAASVVQLRTLGPIIRARLPRRASRTRRARKPRVPANDDGPERLSVVA